MTEIEKTTTIKNLISVYNVSIKNGQDGKELLQTWQHAADIAPIYNDLLKALNINAAAETTPGIEPTAADFEQLAKYIDAGLFFYPCNDDKTPICKIKHDKDGTPVEQNRINTNERLRDFLNGKGTLITDDGKEWNNQKKINMFSLYPNQFNLFCIDIDGATKQDGTTHGTGTNGIAEFLNIIKNTDLSNAQKKMFDNFPLNFPCYVSTPSGGIHLYFKCAAMPSKWNIESNIINNGLRTNIECKYNKQITIAGSVKNGKRYELHGNLLNIPSMPIDLLNKCSKPRPKELNKPFYKNKPSMQDNGKITPQFCIERGKNYAGNVGHNEMFASVISNFHYFYEQTKLQELNQINCKKWIMQDFDFISWQDNNKETQIDDAIKQFYGRI